MDKKLKHPLVKSDVFLQSLHHTEQSYIHKEAYKYPVQRLLATCIWTHGEFADQHPSAIAAVSLFHILSQQCVVHYRPRCSFFIKSFAA